MSLDGVNGHVQSLPDFLVGHLARQEPQDRLLLIAQRHTAVPARAHPDGQARIQMPGNPFREARTRAAGSAAAAGRRSSLFAGSALPVLRWLVVDLPGPVA